MYLTIKGDILQPLDNTEQNSLFLAASNGQVRQIHEMVKNGIDINLRLMRREHAFHHAALVL